MAPTLTEPHLPSSIARPSACATAHSSALSQSQAERTSLRGRSEASTASLRDTVGRQSQVWRACYALLAAAATQDDRIRLLLTGTSRRKTPSPRRGPRPPVSPPLLSLSLPP